MKIENCGLVALDKFQPIEKVSAYSLIQMAKENGVNLLIYRVDVKDLMRVPRPVIIHAKDHFIYIKNGEMLPNHDYTGIVLSQKGFKDGKMLTHNEAKEVLGSKKGGFLQYVIPALLGVVSGGLGFSLFGLGAAATGGLLGAASNIGMNQYAKSNHPEQLGKPGQLGDIAFSGLAGALAGGGGASAAGKFISGFNNPALSSAGAGGSFFQKAGSGFKNIFNPGAPNTGYSYGSTPSGYSGTVTIPGVGSNISAQGLAGGVGTSLSGITPNYNTGYGIIGTKAAPKFDLNNVKQGLSFSSLFGGGDKAGNGGLFGNDLLNSGAAALASQIGKPQLSQGSGKAFDYLSTYLGQNKLPQATTDEINKYVTTPLNDLANSFGTGNDMVIKQINQSFDQQIAAATKQFAQAGQTYQNSSDAQKAIDKIYADKSTALSQAQQQLYDSNLSKAIQYKQWALSQELQNNQYNSTLALELAKLSGQDEELKLAIETNDYNKFQNIIANILYMGYGQQNQFSFGNA